METIANFTAAGVLICIAVAFLFFWRQRHG
jgi:hypothetical protein